MIPLLQVLFIGLKLAHIITWSWWLVFAPLYVAFGFFLLAILGALVAE